MNTVSTLLVTCSAAALLSLTGCASNSKSESASGDAATQVASTQPVNTICPIGGHEVPNNDLTATHKGHTIAFCCEGCADAWEAEDEAGRNAILATALGE